MSQAIAFSGKVRGTVTVVRLSAREANQSYSSVIARTEGHPTLHTPCGCCSIYISHISRSTDHVDPLVVVLMGCARPGKHVRQSCVIQTPRT